MGNFGMQEILISAVFIAGILGAVMLVVRFFRSFGPTFRGSVSYKDMLLNQLAKIQELREKDVLTEELYERERQSLLSKLKAL